MSLRFSLDTFLKEHGLSANRIVKETEGLVARGSVFAMARGENVKRIDMANLEHTLSALSALIGRQVQIGEIITGEAPVVSLRRSAAGPVYTDDAETNDVLDEHPDILERMERWRSKTGATS